jgi:formylglycine-generating enzyme required for sulfatase activity
MRKHGFFYMFSALLLSAPFCLANNINVSNVTLTGFNIAQDYVLVQFDLSWENSWRDDINWDAAWVFVKYQQTGSSGWEHARLNTTAGNHTIPSGYACSVGLTDAYGVGVFIYRNSAGSGNNSLSNVQLRWEYGANLLADGSTVTIKVFAVEMVYVTQGEFYVGDADLDQNNCFYEYGTTSPFRVTGEGAISMGQTSGYLWANSGGYIETATLPATFPKGYAAFYCMKYEISQGQWVDFFNTLNDARKATRDITGSTGKNTDDLWWRNTVSWTTGDATCTRPDRACNYLSWADGAAFADWAGLRPMTELEFEKACRGTQSVVDDEYAWGTANITAATTISGLVEDGTETITNSGANCCYSQVTFTGGDGGQGPLRCGIFAKSTSTRELAGASYYGIMELIGNLYESTVTLGNSTGRGFTGSHGDGSLDGIGDANVLNWPGTNATGAGDRGGDWIKAASYLRVSDRFYAGASTAPRRNYSGFRCVRLAP